MRGVGLVMIVALVGCKQVFGLDEPQPLVGDGGMEPDDARGTPIDARHMTTDGAMPDGSPFLPCDAGDPDLVACFDFENAVVDGSSAMTPAFASNVTYVAGQRGMALHGDTTSTVAVMQSIVFDVTEVSIEAWVYLDELPAGVNLRAGIWDTDGKYGLFVYGDGSVSCTTGNGVRSAALSVGTLQWTHIACTHSVAATRVYVDGALLTQGDGGDITASTGNGSAIAGNAPSGDRLVGAIDQLRVYGAVRTDVQVCASANC